MAEYRWNTSSFAESYDQSAHAVHPYYLELQDWLLDHLPIEQGQPATVVDLGGGSGRLMERILDQFPAVTGIVVDQSQPFLAIAERRLARFGARARCVLSRLQDPWDEQTGRELAAVVSMSAIHHLLPDEKQELYGRISRALRAGGELLNADEVRPVDDADYRREVLLWNDHMLAGLASGAIAEEFQTAYEKWHRRNVEFPDAPRASGDDCLQLASEQLDYFASAGLKSDLPWQKSLWAVLRGCKPYR